MIFILRQSFFYMFNFIVTLSISLFADFLLYEKYQSLLGMVIFNIFVVIFCIFILDIVEQIKQTIRLYKIYKNNKQKFKHFRLKNDFNTSLFLLENIDKYQYIKDYDIKKIADLYHWANFELSMFNNLCDDILYIKTNIKSKAILDALTNEYLIKNYYYHFCKFKDIYEYIRKQNTKLSIKQEEELFFHPNSNIYKELKNLSKRVHMKNILKYFRKHTDIEVIKYLHKLNHDANNFIEYICNKNMNVEKIRIVYIKKQLYEVLSEEEKKYVDKIINIISNEII